jgi:hypothetical protein
MNLKEKHKWWIERFQLKAGLSDYQMLWISFLKGLIIGALIL